jgi:hypothetical protein
MSPLSAPHEPVAASAPGVAPVEGPIFPVGLGLLSVIGALGLPAAWPTTVMLIFVVLVMAAASGIILFWLVRLLGE